jgi:competence protein ComEA
MSSQPTGVLGRILRSRLYLPASIVLSLMLLAGSSVLLLARAGQWPPALGASSPALVITRPSATPGTIHASVMGAVLTPGVYPLADGSTVRDLIEAAGGPQADADLSRLDVTATVADARTIYVPHVGETPPVLIDGKVNLNVATATELHDALDISITEAKRIVNYRGQHGKFQAVSDLLLVPVSQTIFDRIKAMVAV